MHMFADLLRRLTAPASSLAPLDTERALGALLVRIARTDGDYAPEEKRLIDQVLAEEFGLSVEAAKSLRSECEILEGEAPDTVRFTRALKESVPYEARAGLVRALWRVVLADGHRDSGEDALMRMVAPMLGLSDQESHALRREVTAGR